MGMRAPMTLPQGPNQRWSLDSIGDAPICDRCIRILAVVDDSTWGCLALMVGTSPSGAYVAREVDAIITARGAPPPMDVSDSGCRPDQSCNPEMDAGAPCRVVLHRARQCSAELVEGPQQNGYVERFNGRLRNDCLNETLFVSFGHARSKLRLWRGDCRQRATAYVQAGRCPPMLPSVLRHAAPIAIVPTPDLAHDR